MVRYNFFCAGFALLLLTVISTGLMAQVSFSPNRLFAGTAVEVDSTSAVHWVYVQWSGSGLLTVSSAQTIGTDARAYIVTRVPSKPIAPGGLDSIGVQFAPDIEGVPQAELVVSCTAQNFPSDTLPLFGEGILPHLATAAANPANQESNTGRTLLVNFDSVQMGTDSCMQIVLTNPGSETVAIEQTFFSSHDPDFTIQPLFDTLIPPGGSQTLQVCFTPQQQGFRTATVELRTNIPHTQTTPAQDTSAFFVQFNGTGFPQYSSPLLVTGPSTNGTVEVGDSKCVVDTLWNTGDVTIQVDSLITPLPDLGGFSWSIDVSAFTLFPHSHTTFELCASPIDTGAQTELLIAYGTSGVIRDTGILVLNTYGTPGKDSVFLGMPFQTCIPDSDVVPIQVLNQGYLAELYSANITGLNAADFTIQPGTQVPKLPGQHATFNVSFHPSIPGMETATITVYGSESEGGSLVLTASSGAATITGSGTAGMTAVGAIDTFTIPLQNAGTCDWAPGHVTVDPPFYYLSGDSTNIPAGTTGSLTMTFAPTQDGNFSSNVTFTNSIGFVYPTPNIVADGIASVALVNETAEIDGYALGQSYPNPTNGQSAVSITVPQGGPVQLTIMDLQENVIQSVLNQHFGAGTFNVKLDASAFPSGTYYYQMSANGVTLTRQMTVIK